MLNCMLHNVNPLMLSTIDQFFLSFMYIFTTSPIICSAKYDNEYYNFCNNYTGQQKNKFFGHLFIFHIKQLHAIYIYVEIIKYYKY